MTQCPSCMTPSLKQTHLARDLLPQPYLEENKAKRIDHWWSARLCYQYLLHFTPYQPCRLIALRSASVSDSDSQPCFPGRPRHVCIRYFNNAVQSALQATYLVQEQVLVRMNLRGPLVQYSGVTDNTVQYRRLTTYIRVARLPTCSIQQVRTSFAFYDTSTVGWLYLWKVLHFYYDAITRLPYHQI